MLTENFITARLINAGYEVYLVGGAVRDKILGHTPKDFDFATNAKPDEIIKLFPNEHINLVGKSFKVVFINGIQIATYRKDNQKTFFNAKYCEPEYTDSIIEDLGRRDLTVNAMAINLVTNEFLDPFNGVKDLRTRTIRFVGDPIRRIQEDPNRIVRACRFVAKLEGSFHKSAYAALCECAIFIKRYVEVERIQDEILEAMLVDTPSIFFSALQSIGALKYIFPAMADSFHQIGGEFHKETVGEHLMLAGDGVSKRFPIVRLAAFLHDIGKPEAFKREADGSFKAHEMYGAKYAEKYLKKLKFPTTVTNKVVGLIASHMRVCRGLTPKGVRRLRKHLLDDGVDPRSFIRLKLADRSANLLRTRTEIQPVRELIINAGIRSVETPVLTLKDLAITGGDLITEFGLKPGPVVGKTHKALLEFIIEEGEEYNTYEILKEKAKNILFE